MTGRRKRGTAQPAHRIDSESGIALLLALLVILSLTAFSLSLVLFTQSESRLSNTIAAQSQAYYAAVAGLEEARGRLNPSALGAIGTLALPQQINQVLYLVNSTSQDPVTPRMRPLLIMTTSTRRSLVAVLPPPKCSPRWPATSLAQERPT